jgi:uncharacterized protein YfaS (alpha-2-macroglobulin family)
MPKNKTPLAPEEMITVSRAELQMLLDEREVLSNLNDMLRGEKAAADYVIEEIRTNYKEGYRDLHEELAEASKETQLANEISQVLADRLKQFQEALVWCSGSADFGPGGVAREGWERLCQPLLSAPVLTPSQDESAAA